MKDYVFIGWSKNRELAIKVKDLIDQKGFVGVIGGIYEDNPENLRRRKGTVNETINYQMNHCDQAILLFQKIDENLSISGNLIYELGYITAQYNYIGSSTKLHIFKIDITQADDNLFPTDLHGVWGTLITGNDKTIDEMANEIVQDFLKSQKQIEKKDKIQLLNDYHMIEFEIMKHFESPNMSDYDLAKNILVYSQAAFCYQEQLDIKLKIERFESQLLEKANATKELCWAADYAKLTLNLFCQTIPNEESLTIKMDGMTFRKTLNRYKDIGEKISENFESYFSENELSDLIITEEFNNLNDFESLLIAQTQEIVTYLILVYLNSDSLSENERIKYSKEGIKYCLSAIANLELISRNGSDEMYAKLLLSYAYKNLSTFYNNIENFEDGVKYSKKSYKLRRRLNVYINEIPFIRPSLKDYITLEYLMQVVDVIKNCDDEYMVADYMKEIEQYLKRRSVADSVRNLMVNALAAEYNNLKSK